MLKRRRGSMLILLFALTLISSLTVPYLYLDHVKQKKVNNTVTVCRETMEFVGAVNDHYMAFIKASGEYIDMVEQQVRAIRLNYDSGSITRAQMLSQTAALSSVEEQDILIKGLWQASGNTLAMPTGSESSAAFIERLGIEDMVNGDIGSSDTIKSVTVNSDIISWVTSPTVLSHIPQVWTVEITITPSDGLDIGALRKNLFDNINSTVTQNNECIKISVAKAAADGITILIEYSVSGILEDNMSIFGM